MSCYIHDDRTFDLKIQAVVFWGAGNLYNLDEMEREMIFYKTMKKIFFNLFSIWEKCVSLNCGNFCRTAHILWCEMASFMYLVSLVTEVLPSPTRSFRNRASSFIEEFYPSVIRSSPANHWPGLELHFWLRDYVTRFWYGAAILRKRESDKEAWYFLGPLFSYLNGCPTLQL